MLFSPDIWLATTWRPRPPEFGPKLSSLSKPENTLAASPPEELGEPVHCLLFPKCGPTPLACVGAGGYPTISVLGKGTPILLPGDNAQLLLPHPHPSDLVPELPAPAPFGSGTHRESLKNRGSWNSLVELRVGTAVLLEPLECSAEPHPIFLGTHGTHPNGPSRVGVADAAGLPLGALPVSLADKLEMVDLVWNADRSSSPSPSQILLQGRSSLSDTHSAGQARLRIWTEDRYATRSEPLSEIAMLFVSRPKPQCSLSLLKK